MAKVLFRRAAGKMGIGKMGNWKMGMAFSNHEVNVALFLLSLQAMVKRVPSKQIHN